MSIFGNIEVICDFDKWDFCGKEYIDFYLKWVDKRMECEEIKVLKIVYWISCFFCFGSWGIVWWRRW